MSHQNETRATLEEWAGSQHLSLTLLFTDIVRSTDIGVKLGDRKWIEDLFVHFSYARTLADLFDCYVVKVIGDAFMVAFRTSTDAVDFAIKFATDTGIDYIGIRVTINSGQVQIRENDIYGLNVNLTSRMQKHLLTEGILVSNSVKEDYESISGKGDSGISFSRRDRDLESFGRRVLWTVMTQVHREAIRNQRKARVQLLGDRSQ